MASNRLGGARPHLSLGGRERFATNRVNDAARPLTASGLAPPAVFHHRTAAALAAGAVERGFLGGEHYWTWESPGSGGACRGSLGVIFSDTPQEL